MIKLKEIVTRFNRVNRILERDQQRIGTQFAAFIQELELQIKQKFISSLPKLKQYQDDFASFNLYVAILLEDVKKLINSKISIHLKDVEVLYTGTEQIAIRNIIASMLFSVDDAIRKLSKNFVSISDYERISFSLLSVQQAAIATKFLSFADDYVRAVELYAFTNLLDKIRIYGSVMDSVSITIISDFEEDSPFRISNMTPISKASVLGTNETHLAYLSMFGALAYSLKKDDPEERLFARSMAIHDGNAWPDSLEAEDITKDWVEFPSPYYEITDFRRRPNCRCYDIILPISQLTEEGITPEVLQEE